MRNVLKAAVVVAPLAIAPQALATPADPDCHVRVLRTITDDIGNVWQTGNVLPVTILRHPTGQPALFCAHGGSCLPRMVEGKQAVRLIDCRPGPALGNGDYQLIRKP